MNGFAFIFEAATTHAILTEAYTPLASLGDAVAQIRCGKSFQPECWSVHMKKKIVDAQQSIVLNTYSICLFHGC